jgi:chromate reductase, NAD(P)H dehydrogenase (quinone)
MGTTRHVAVIVGSLRKESFNRKMANALIAMAPAPLVLSVVEIGQLPLFNQDLEANPPASVSAFKQGIAAADALLFVTPEYNRSVPGVLKNAIDVGSRPSGKNSWGGKPGAIVSVSPGKLAAFGANHALRQSLVAVDVPTMPQPEAYVGNAASLFDDKGALIDESTARFMQKFLASFALWIERNAPL